MKATDAFDACHSLSGQLPMPFNQATLTNVRKLSESQTSGSIWLGVYRKEQNGDWFSVYDSKPYSRPYPIGSNGNNDAEDMYLGPISRYQSNEKLVLILFNFLLKVQIINLIKL